MAPTDQQPVRSHCNAKGLLGLPFFAMRVMLAQPQVSLQCSRNLLHRPPALRRTYYCSRRPLVQIGFQKSRTLRADIAAINQTQVRAKHSKGLASCGRWEASNLRPSAIETWHMRRYIFLSLWSQRFPRPCHCDYKPSAPSKISCITLLYLLQDYTQRRL
jgi:hypothetical protein